MIHQKTTLFPGCTGVIVLIFFSLTSVAQEIFVQYGQASFYADKFNGEKTASGEIFSNDKLTAAHLTLPFGSMVKVTNLKNHRSIVVRINDRGPYVEGRIIDLTKMADRMLGFTNQGTAKVKIELVTPTPNISVRKQETRASGSGAKSYYTFIARKIQPQGYGVQTGSFRELSNLMNITDKLSEKDKKRLVIQTATVNNVRVYRVIFGQYKTRKEAERERNRIKKIYPDAFVISY